jgi:metallo-beta-lactamase family protein
LAYVRAINPLPSTVFIVHGEEKQALSLGAAIQAEHPKIDVRIPHQGSTHEV